jgi:DNA invertase Pin-like site-specific DNA recombinase
MATFAYLRVSTNQQDLENQKLGVLEYANKKGFTIDKFWQETVTTRKKLQSRDLWLLMQQLKKGDILLVSEISRLARSLMEIMEIIKKLLEIGVEIHIVKQNFIIGDKANKIQSSVLIFAFGLAAEIERELISQRTKEALAKRKADGVQLGRKKGSRNEKRKLDEYRNDIERYLKQGIPKTIIAKLLNININTLYYYVKTELKKDTKA